jgi:CubicO group peptidase (beta-lactamase class C family)
MKESSLVWEKPFDQAAATGHTEAGAPIPKRKPLKHNAAASLHTTASDYARFMIAVMNGAGLKPATARAMVERQTKVDQSCSNCIGRPVTQPSESIFWGLGVGLQHTAAGDSFWHWGDNGVFRCLMVGYPSQKKGIVIFTNSAHGLAIAPQITRLAMRDEQPLSAWINYASFDSLPFRLLHTIRGQGIEAGICLYRTAAPGAITERQMNSLGYSLLGAKKIREAIEVFKLNVEAYPKSFNVYDSLGEAYMANGDTELAIKNYEISVQMNPENTGGIEALKKLRAK